MLDLPRTITAVLRRRDLLKAIEREDIERVAALLDSGVDPNYKSGAGLTPLVASTRCDHPAIYSTLARHGATFDPEFNGPELFDSVLNKFESTWRRVALRCLDDRPWRPDNLHEVITKAFADRKRLLFGLALLCRVKRRWPDLEPERFKEGLKPVTLDFGRRAHRRVVRAFDRLGLLDILQTQDGDRGLQVALWAGLPDIAERLLNEGVDVVSFATFGKPPLLVAGIAGLKAISIRLRVLQPSSWSRRDRSQADVDMYSVMAQGDDVLLNWLRNGGDPNTLVRGTSALSLALANGRERSAALLLAFGATIEDFDDEGFPPLARAADMGSIGLVRLFLWHGCDPNQAGRDLRYNSIPVLGAVRQEDTQVLEALIEAGADINARSRGGETALTLSAIRGNNAAIEVLARNGVDLRVATSDGWGAMHWAVLGGREVGKRERTIRLLARIGVDLNLQDRNGRNALDFAMSKNEFEVAAVLRDLGLGDAYSVPERWKRRVVAGKFDYFVSYRWHRFGDAARSLAARLREAGCEVFLDATEPVLREYQEADPPRQIPLQKLRRTLFLAAQSSLCTLFFESTLDAAVDPRAGTTVTNFSWQLFERFYSRAWVLLRSSQDDDDVRNFVAAAKVRREYFHSGAE